MNGTSKNIQGRVHQFAIISSLFVGIVLLIWSISYLNHDWNDRVAESFKSKVIWIGGIWMILGILLLILKKTKQFSGLLLSLSTINFIYLAGEVITYLLIISNIVTPRHSIEDASFGVFNRPCARYDSVSGYKWLPVDCRVTKIVNKAIVFDHRFTPNNKGYLSKWNYRFKKKDPSTLRYLVFGDSFTAGMYMEDSWPDYVQEKLNQHATNQKFEIYSFAIDGGGLFNWHRIFMKEVLPYYDFDGIIIAAWGNNFAREFAIMHHEKDGAYFGYFDDVPQSYKDFQEHYFPEMWYTEIVPDSMIDQKIEKATNVQKGTIQLEKPDLYLLMKLYDKFTKLAHLEKQKGFEQRFISSRKDFLSDYTIQAFIDRYGEERFSKLDTMIKYCQANGKEVIFCTQADETGIKSIKIGDYHWMQGELEGLAKHYNAHYFDGLQYYLDLTDEELETCFLKYDFHWSQTGSNIFAENFYHYLVEMQRADLK